jgi:hypothetical protein
MDAFTSAEAGTDRPSSWSITSPGTSTGSTPNAAPSAFLNSFTNLPSISTILHP